MPRVSVIVAARDVEATLPRTLASIDAQSYTDWEVVVIDDGSSDATADIARTFTGPSQLISNATSLGPSAARNAGARAARGELLAMLDADDVWKPGYLAHVVGRYDAARAQGRRVGLVQCDMDLAGDEGLIGQTHQRRVGLRRPVSLDMLLRGNVLGPMALCPRDVFFEAGGYDERMRYAEEYDLWLRIAERRYEILADPDVLAIYRMHGGAASVDTIRMAEGCVLVCELALERGALTARQRRIVRRQRRLQLLVAERARLAAAKRDGSPVAGRIVRAAPLFVLTALEHPERWWQWLRRGPRAADGVSRHVWADESRGRLARRRAERRQRRFDAAP